ncbi:MAG: ATP-binding protein [Nitrolancea sp.]
MLTRPDNWMVENQTYLTASLDRLRRSISARLEFDEADAADLGTQLLDIDLDGLRAQMSTEPAILRIQQLFNLSPFERDVLLLCAGVDLDSSFARVLSSANGDPLKTYPTFGLALSLLPNAHWTAMAPASPLRRWHLIEIGAGHSFTQSPLRIDERILHSLIGVEQPDERLATMLEPLGWTTTLVPSHESVAQAIVEVWRQSGQSGASPVIQLCGSDSSGKRDIAVAAFRSLGCSAYGIPADMIPLTSRDLDLLATLWRREMRLSSIGLLVDCDELDLGETQRRNTMSWLIERMWGPLLISTPERMRVRQRPTVVFDVGKPKRAEQRQIWQSVLGENVAKLNGSFDALTSQFNMSTSLIQAAGTQALANHMSDEARELDHTVWDAARGHTRPQLEALAQRLDPSADWDDLILPEPQRLLLREIAVHARNRGTVYDAWGFGSKGSRGLGISALFAGTSGTGKTMAAEVLANSLRLDLYRIDLSNVVSKYIGETEKNLRRVFDAADAGGAILLFDEADALFGKRSEVKDSHDRYANIEVSYLLQRMEAYQGLAILTTNLKSALDSAFLRRIRFVVHFPFPDAAQRAEIWRRIFPREVPLAEIDFAKLARLNVTGGNIRNIALGAAFLAADTREPVGMDHLLHAARTEYAKLEKPLTESEIAGWT